MSETLFDTAPLERFVRLAERLPTSLTPPRALCCDKCGASLGAVGNDGAVAIGTFTSDVEVRNGIVAIGERLEKATVIREMTVPFKCDCGFTSRFRLRQTR